MKKNVIEAPASRAATGGNEQWLDLEQLASVEVTSENPDYPVESVFSAVPGQGWRAAKPGQQNIKLLFAEPQTIHKIHLEFSETERTRLQEFTLRWSTAESGSFQEIVRQQWNFSPQGSTSQVEDYQVNLDGVSVLELALNPDLSGGGAIASLLRWRVG